MSKYDIGALAFGSASTLLYVGWGWFASGTPEKHMSYALWFYACANVALLWPQISRLFL